MLYSRYYSIIAEDRWQHIALQNDNILAIQANVSTSDDLRTIYQFITRLANQNCFCLNVSIDAVIDDGIAADIISFFFFRNYKKYKSKAPELLVQCKKEECLQHFTELLTINAKVQGFTEVKIIRVNVSEDKGVPVFSIRDIEALKKAHKTFLKDQLSFENFLLIEVSEERDLEFINNLLEEEEQQFFQQHHSLAELKRQNKQLKEQLVQAEIRFEAAEQEIENMASHIDILRSSSQAKDLQHYYNNEYEVLPLWYKRLGHIIKAIMGKRTFGSLFNDNERKYKQ